MPDSLISTSKFPAPGIYANIPEGEYHSSPGVSQSRLKKFLNCAAKAKYGTPIETNELRFGSLIHTAILEPDALDLRYAVTDLTTRNTKAWAAAEAAAVGRELVKRPNWDEARAIRDAVYAHPGARSLLQAPSLVTEQSFYWVDEVTGLLCRGRADIVCAGWNVLADIKSTRDASKVGFSNSMAEYGYHIQSAYYRNGYPLASGFSVDAFAFVCVEKEPPYLVGFYETTAQAFSKGHEQYREALDGWAECERTGVWPGYADELVEVDLPPWAYR